MRSKPWHEVAHALSARTNQLPMTAEVQALVLIALSEVYSLLDPAIRERMDDELHDICENTAQLVGLIQAGV